MASRDSPNADHFPVKTAGEDNIAVLAVDSNDGLGWKNDKSQDFPS